MRPEEGRCTSRTQAGSWPGPGAYVFSGRQTGGTAWRNGSTAGSPPAGLAARLAACLPALCTRLSLIACEQPAKPVPRHNMSLPGSPRRQLAGRPPPPPPPCPPGRWSSPSSPPPWSWPWSAPSWRAPSTRASRWRSWPHLHSTPLGRWRSRGWVGGWAWAGAVLGALGPVGRGGRGRGHGCAVQPVQRAEGQSCPASLAGSTSEAQ